MRLPKAILCAFLLLLAVPSFARSRVDTVRVDVLLQDDGSALVSETWVIDVAGNITEWYLGKENLGPMRISGLRVTDESGIEYVSEGYGWDIDRSREAKAHRCGIVDKGDGCELCWGVGSPGRHTYVASYLLSGLVKGYSDKDGFNHMFVTPSDGEPRAVFLTIRKPGTILTSDNTSVWGFGFHGEVQVLEGAAKYWSTEAFGAKGSLIAMVAFEKGIFNPSIAYDKPFEEVKEAALKGSDYKKPGLLQRLGNLLLVWFPLLVFLLVVVGKGISDHLRKRQLIGGGMKDLDWFRDVPVGGDLRKASNILRVFSRKTVTENQNLIAAYMMRLFYEGAFELVPQASGNPAFKVVGLKPPTDEAPSLDRTLATGLFSFFKEAAGSDSILQEKELRNWAGRNGERLYAWQAGIADGSGLKTLEPADVRQVFGLKKFLKDFTLIRDRGAVEVRLWNEYLVFASLYGIADQVYRDFKKACPEYFTLSRTVGQVQEVTPTVFWNTISNTSRHFNRSAMNYALHKGNPSGNRWGGGGGMTSFGGGGGFSGGGRSGGR